MAITSTRLLLILSLGALLVLSTSFLIINPSQASGIVYVNSNVSGGSNDGSSWADAYDDLQSALAVVTGEEEIWVASGIYIPGSTISDTFQLVNDVAIYGGFVGTETLRAERNWREHVTVLSGDIEANDLTDPNGIVTDTTHIVGNNSFHILTGSGVLPSAVLDGFTITAGEATSASPNDRGGGLLNTNGSPTLVNVTFSANLANGGGGVFNNSGSAPAFTNVIFYANSALFDGGGVFNNNGSSPTFTNVAFITNTARAGGGMINVNSSNPLLTNVTFAENAVSGGSARGGGIFNNGSSPTIVNSIFWANSAAAGASLFNNGSTPTISYSLIEESGGSGAWVVAFGSDGGNNIDIDPLFITPTVESNIFGFAANLQLQNGSPAVDSGNTLSYTQMITVDLAGNSRIQNSVIDMGAFESDGSDQRASNLIYMALVSSEEEASLMPTQPPVPTLTPIPTVTPEPSRNLNPGTTEIALEQMIEGETVSRTFYIQAPDTLDNSQSYPIVFAFHGAGGSGQSFVNNTHLNVLIDSGAFIGVYPSGYSTLGGDGGFWNLGNEPTNADDIAFVDMIVQELATYMALDTGRMYGIGYSNGAGMINLLGKSTTYFRAISPIVSQQSVTTTAIMPARTLSVIQLNGDSDTLIPIGGGPSAVGDFVSAELSAINWATSFNCSDEAIEETVTWGETTLDSFSYTNCDDGHEIRYYVAYGMGHSGFGDDEATSTHYQTIWAFFQQH
ncbi:MAG: choice-of-anchor Q domain-containing protein [Chloroflexota bacterium]